MLRNREKLFSKFNQMFIVTFFHQWIPFHLSLNNSTLNYPIFITKIQSIIYKAVTNSSRFVFQEVKQIKMWGNWWHVTNMVLTKIELVRWSVATKEMKKNVHKRDNVRSFMKSAFRIICYIKGFVLCLYILLHFCHKCRKNSCHIYCDGLISCL